MSATDPQKGKIFERRVGNLFALLGFSVEVDVLVGGRQVDLLLEDRRGPLSQIYIVECKDQAAPVNTAQYDAFRGRLQAARREISAKIRGVLVSSVGFVKEARAQNEHDEGIELLSISDLETRVIDFRQYVRDLVEENRRDRLPYFVEPKLRREYQELGQPAFAFFQEWIADPVSNHLTLLGDYGTGKTTLLKHLSYVLAERYQQEVFEGGARARVPIYIDLRDYLHAISLKQIILDFLDTHSIRANSYSAFEHVLKEGQLLLILDGFDEMASRGNYALTVRNFRELNQTAQGRAKVILSSRTHYFTTHRDVQRLLHGQAVPETPYLSSYTDLYREIATRPNFLICYLSEFEPSQVEEYLRRRCGSRWADVQRFIAGTYNLTELSRKPVLLDMIVTVEQRTHERPDAITPGILYQVYTDFWLQRNDWSLTINPSTKSRLLEHFAELAAEHPQNQVHHSQIQRVIQQWDPSITSDDATLIDQELRTASFLVRDAEGNYRFSHRSFQEFFYARFLLSCAVRGVAGPWEQGFFRTEIYRFLRDVMQTQPPAVEALLAWLADEARPLLLHVNAVKALGGTSAPAVVDTLVRLLAGSPHALVRRSAATSLGSGGAAAVEALKAAVLSDPDPHVRTNACMVLGRMNTPEGNDFLLQVLSAARGVGFREASWPLYREATSVKDPRLVEALLYRALPSGRSSHTAVEGCLALCAARWSETAREFCLDVLERTTSPKLASRAFALLPVADRGPYLDKVLTLLRRYANHAHTDTWLDCLRRVGDPAVQDFLVECVVAEKGSATAFDILVSEYPDVIRARAPGWMTGGHPYSMRIRSARAYASLGAPDALDHIVTLISRRERVVTQIHALQILADLYPDRFADVVRERLVREHPPTVKRFALELLQQVDAPAAVSLMLTTGLRDARVGTRVAVCGILSATPTEEVSQALLAALREDDSRWVRIQALRSLCAPGRSITRDQVMEASRNEKDREVLAVRGTLLNA